MREIIKLDSDPSSSFSEGRSILDHQLTTGAIPFFSVRKLRIIYNELHELQDFEYHSFDEFEHQVMSSVAPQAELNKWQAISSRR